MRWETTWSSRGAYNVTPAAASGIKENTHTTSLVVSGSEISDIGVRRSAFGIWRASSDGPSRVIPPE